MARMPLSKSESYRLIYQVGKPSYINGILAPESILRAKLLYLHHYTGICNCVCDIDIDIDKMLA